MLAQVRICDCLVCIQEPLFTSGILCPFTAWLCLGTRSYSCRIKSPYWVFKQIHQGDENSAVHDHWDATETPVACEDQNCWVVFLGQRIQRPRSLGGIVRMYQKIVSLLRVLQVTKSHHFVIQKILMIKRIRIRFIPWFARYMREARSSFT